MTAAGAPDLFLRGAAAGLLLFHVVHLLRPGAHASARYALAGFTASALGYLFCSLPQPYAPIAPWRVPLLALCVASAPLLWLAMRALFQDGFRLAWPTVVLIVGVVAIGTAAHTDTVVRWLDAASMHRLSVAFQFVLIAFALTALWVALREWRSDLVEARRITRAWVAVLLGVYVALVLFVELALAGEAVPAWLPTLHVAGISLVALALALLVAARPLDVLLAHPATDEADGVPVAGAAPVRLKPVEEQLRARLLHEMQTERVYRGENLSLPSLAARLGTSEATLRRVINEALGYRNFNDFLHRYRIDEARHRLAREDTPILTIALEAGYGSIGPFNRAFRQRVGTTPSAFRASSRLGRAPASG